MSTSVLLHRNTYTHTHKISMEKERRSYIISTLNNIPNEEKKTPEVLNARESRLKARENILSHVSGVCAFSIVCVCASAPAHKVYAIMYIYRSTDIRVYKIKEKTHKILGELSSFRECAHARTHTQIDTTLANLLLVVVFAWLGFIQTHLSSPLIFVLFTPSWPRSRRRRQRLRR